MAPMPKVRFIARHSEEGRRLLAPPPDWPVPVLSGNEFDAFIAPAHLTAVWFFAVWGATDRMLAGLLRELPVDQRALGAFAAFNIDSADDEHNPAVRCHIVSVTTVIAFRHGEEVQRFTGLQSETLRRLLAELGAPQLGGNAR